MSFREFGELKPGEFMKLDPEGSVIVSVSESAETRMGLRAARVLSAKGIEWNFMLEKERKASMVSSEL